VVRSLKEQAAPRLQRLGRRARRRLPVEPRDARIVAISGSTAYLDGQMREVDEALTACAAASAAEIVDSWVEML